MISTRSRFALHGLCYIAKVAGDEPISFPEVFSYLLGWSDRLTLSKGYISRIFQDLSRAGLVRSVPGRNGGYRLARSPRDVTLMDVVRAVERPISNDCCLLADGMCALQDQCGIVEVIEEAQRSFDRVLISQTIESMARKIPLPAVAPRRPSAPTRR